MSEDHLWDSDQPNCFCESGLREFEIQGGWAAYLKDRDNTKSAFLGPLLWHYWSTPKRDCELCSDEAYCQQCRKLYADRHPVPHQRNHLWLCIAMEPGYCGGPNITIVEVCRQDEQDIRQWLTEQYAKRGLRML